MDAAPTPNFETLLKAAKSKLPAQLKLIEIKRLLDTAGKRPTELQANQIAELVTSEPGNPALVYEILGTLELAASPNAKLAPLKPALWRAVQSWHRTPPPPGVEIEPVMSWLETELEPSAGAEHDKRTRAAVLWLVAQYRNPDLFLKALQRSGAWLERLSARPGEQPKLGRQVNTGFIMADLAKKLFSCGRGANPKFNQVSEITTVIGSVLAHVREQSTAAESALNKMAEMEGSLAEQQRINAEQGHRIEQLEQMEDSLQSQITVQTEEIARVTYLHQQALGHAASQISGGKMATLSDLRSKIQPRLRDARLYINRPAPAMDQLLRLLAEIEAVLQPKETPE